MPDALPRDLHYVDDTQPGITRRKLRGKFCYFGPTGQRIVDPQEIQRINALAVPPAYTDVWICSDPRGHLQATGRDARGRKQYRYHPRWREVRDSDKYSRLRDFGLALPKLRKQLETLLEAPGLSRDKVMATVITLLDATLIRVGNTQYARDNRSYGLTTLRNRHVEVNGSAIQFQFRGKSGVEHQITVKDRRLARIIKRCQDIPGQNLFQYLDENGERHTITSADVNAYLQTLTGADFTAKDYRTWAGSALALAVLRELEWQLESQAKQHVVAMVKDVARQLGNTPAVCRKCYIHPAVLEGFLLGALAQLPKPRVRKGLRAEEVALAMLLEKMACGEAMEDIFVVKRCNKIIIHGRRAGETTHQPAEAAVWYRIADTRTNGFIGDGYDHEYDAQRSITTLLTLLDSRQVRLAAACKEIADWVDHQGGHPTALRIRDRLNDIEKDTPLIRNTLSSLKPRNAARRAARKAKTAHVVNDWRQAWTERLTAMAGMQRLPRGFHGQGFV
eukprot:gene3566-3489_t